MNETGAVRGQIREVVQELRLLKLRLSSMAASLPPSQKGSS